MALGLMYVLIGPAGCDCNGGGDGMDSGVDRGLIGCGNGIVEGDEVCDDGNLVDGDGCEADCTPTPMPVCGDGVVEGDEQCDDGNTMPGDGCDGMCMDEEAMPTCGDGIVEGDEQCDDGNAMPGDGCDGMCMDEEPMPVCGDGVVEGDEECDDGNTMPGDGCDGMCLDEEPPMAVCGDGVVEGDEECDDGNTLPDDGCDGMCMEEPVDVTVRFDGSMAAPGELATVAVTFEDDMVDLVGLQFDMREPSGRLTLRAQGAMPPGAALGSDADAAGKEINVVPGAGAGGATRVTIFALNVDVIDDADGDGTKEVALLTFDVAADAASGPVPLDLEEVVVTNAVGQSNQPGAGLTARIEQVPVEVP